MNNKELIEALDASPVLDAEQRSIKAHVDLRPAVNDPDATVRLNVSVHHHKEAKAFSTWIYISQDSTEGPFAVSKMEPMNRAHNLRLPPIPVARYSVKALKEARRQSINLLWHAPELLDAMALDVEQVQA